MKFRTNILIMLEMYDHLCEMDDFSFLLELQLSHFIKLKVYGCKSDYSIKRLPRCKIPLDSRSSSLRLKWSYSL